MEKTLDYGWEEATPGSSSYINPAILKIAAEHKARTVLDAGCGNGALAADLARAGHEVVGIDGDAGGIEIARKRYPGARFEVGTFEGDPPGQFDFVCSTEVVEHLYSPHLLAEYCYKALRPGGTLAMSTPYHGYLKNLALSVFDKWDKHHTVDWHGGHIKFWSRNTLSKLLENAGFDVTGFAGVGRLPYLWMSMILIARKPDGRG
ncbi:MAG TPA: class I SAM-dependent methyltransferase [Sphingomonas sp.]|nr:class I SAM-dependent methyltransferase [Sphingomonas sp.]